MSNYQLNFKRLSINIFTIYMLTASLYHAVFRSISLQLLILITILVILIINIIITRTEIYLFKLDIFFILMAMTLLLLIFRLDEITIVSTADLIIIVLSLLTSLLFRGDIENYNQSFNIIVIFGLIYAISIFIQLSLPNLYNTIFLKYIHIDTANEIANATNEGYYTGFTGQVAFTAGYLTFALGILIVKFITKEVKYSKRHIFIFGILLLGLILTQKRGLILILLMSTSFIYWIYIGKSLSKIINLLKKGIIYFVMLIPIIIMVFYTNIGNSILTRFIKTIDALKAGEDITSNRISLWYHSFDLIKKNPLFGIGWGNYRGSIVGVVTEVKELEAHNIYLQLLAETGIIGTTFILLPVLLTFLITLKLLNRNKYEKIEQKWINPLYYSCFIQVFFLLYGLIGNPLYDYPFLLGYVFSISLVYSYFHINTKTSRRFLIE